MFTLWRTKWIHVLSQQSNSPWLGLISWLGPECGFFTCTDGCSVGVDVYTRSQRSALTATLSEPGVSAKIFANSHDEPFHLDYNQPPSQYLPSTARTSRTPLEEIHGKKPEVFWVATNTILWQLGKKLLVKYTTNTLVCMVRHRNHAHQIIKMFTFTLLVTLVTPDVRSIASWIVM